MRNLKFTLLLLVGSMLFLTIIGFNLVLPDDTQASPLYGFTPDPPPPPDGGGGNDGGGSDDEDTTESSTDKPSKPSNEPTEYVVVKLEQCDMVCSEYVDIADTVPTGELLASVGDGVLPSFTFAPKAVVPFEVLVPVKLVHEGSGWIAESTLSTHGDTRIALPYTGYWEIFLTGQPQFVTADAVDVTGTNLAQLQADVLNTPISLGKVEANVIEVQLVKCPIACVIEPPQEEIYLPETGAEPTTGISLLLIAGTIFATGLLRLPLYRAYAHKYQPELVQNIKIKISQRK